MQLHSENVIGIEKKLERCSIKIRNGTHGSIPITNISPHIKKNYHRFITGCSPGNSKIKKIIT